MAGQEFSARLPANARLVRGQSFEPIRLTVDGRALAALELSSSYGMGGPPWLNAPWTELPITTGQGIRWRASIIPPPRGFANAIY